MKLVAVIFVGLATVLTRQSGAQTNASDNFSITLERTGCLGSCPVYKVTILGDGSVRYEGEDYVRIKGIHEKTIPISAVQKLVQKLRYEGFFRWEEAKTVCLDFPDVNITATLDGQSKHVLEGCNTPGKVLRLAYEIDRITGAKRWIGKVR